VLYLVEKIDTYLWWVRDMTGCPVGFTVSEGVIWVSVLLSGEWSVHTSLQEALGALIKAADAL
jgi:hypothetical protein